LQMRSTTAEKAIDSQLVMLNTRPTAASGAQSECGRPAASVRRACAVQELSTDWIRPRHCSAASKPLWEC
jgi:hypothetical protein